MPNTVCDYSDFFMNDFKELEINNIYDLNP